MKSSELLKHRVVMFHGEEAALSIASADALVKAAGLMKDDFDLETRSGDDGDPSDWLGGASTAPFLAERRVVVVRHALRIDPERVSATSLRALPPESLVVLVADEEVANSPERVARLARTETALVKLVKTTGGTAVEFKHDPKQSRNMVKAALVADGYKISEKALDTLMEMCSLRYGRALEEAEKLKLFAEKGLIREEDVRDVVVPSREFAIFKLVDCVMQNKAAEALSQLKNIVTSNKKPEDVAFSAILPQLSRTLKLLWQARVCVEGECSPDDPTPEVAARLTDKPDIRKISPYQSGPLMRSARNASFGRIARCLAVVSDGDARLKGALPGYSAMETLERMVLEMAEAIHPTAKTV